LVVGLDFSMEKSCGSTRTDWNLKEHMTPDLMGLTRKGGDSS